MFLPYIPSSARQRYGRAKYFFVWHYQIAEKIHNNADLSLRSMFTFSRPVTALLMDVFIGVNCGGGGSLLLSESVRMCRPLDPLFSPRVDPPVGYSKVKHTPVGYYFFIWSHSLGEICEIFISSHSGWDKTSSRWYFGRLILNRFGVKCFPPPHTPPHTPPPPPTPRVNSFISPWEISIKS